MSELAPTLTLIDTYPSLGGFVRRVLRRHGIPSADLEDLAQEVFVTMHRKRCSFADLRGARAWLFATARGVASNYRRARQRAAERVPLWTASEPPRPDAVVERSELARMVDRFAEGLSADARAVFRLATLEGLPAPQVAAQLGLGIDTTYSHIRRTRERFAKAALAVIGLIALLLALLGGTCSSGGRDDLDRVALRARASITS